MGSPLAANTIGIVWVAALPICGEGSPPLAAITATCRRTNSAANRNRGRCPRGAAAVLAIGRGRRLAALLKSYNVSKVVGDHYGGEFVKEPFRRNGISYEVCKQPKSNLYRDLLPSLNSGQLVLPRHDRLIAQIVGLERRVSRAGKDSIGHPPHGHDDNANSGVVGAISGVGAFDFEFWHDDRAWSGGAPSSDELLWFLRR